MTERQRLFKVRPGQGAGRNLLQGVWHEWIRAVKARGGLAGGRLQGTLGQIRGGVAPEVVKYAWDDLLEAAGVRQLLYAWGRWRLSKPASARALSSRPGPAARPSGRRGRSTARPTG